MIKTAFHGYSPFLIKRTDASYYLKEEKKKQVDMKVVGFYQSSVAPVEA